MSWRSAVAGGLAGPARAYVRHAPTRALKPLLLRRLLEPALRGRPRAFRTTTADGLVLDGDTRDMIERYLYLFGVWEPALTEWLRPRLLAGRTFVDVGANLGYFSLLAAKTMGPTGRVVAIEALPATFERLQRNLRLNRADTVRAVNVAASDAPGVLTLFGGEVHNSGTTTTVPGSGLAELGRVRAEPLATLLTAEEAQTVRVVKIDVEGAEAAVLLGLAPILSELPTDAEIVVEVSPGDDGGAAALDLFSEQGFHPFRLDNDYRLVSYLDPPAAAPLPRFHGPVTERIDLVFSRMTGETLR